MSKIYIDLTDDEQHWNGRIELHVLDTDTLTGHNVGLSIGNELEIVLSVPQSVSLFDLLDGWLNKYPVRVVGDVERRVISAIKTTIEDYGSALRAMNSRPEELARALYDNMKLGGVRFRLKGEK